MPSPAISAASNTITCLVTVSVSRQRTGMLHQPQQYHFVQFFQHLCIQKKNWNFSFTCKTKSKQVWNFSTAIAINWRQRKWNMRWNTLCTVAMSHYNASPNLCICIVWVPCITKRLLSSNVPHYKSNTLPYNLFNITSNCWRRLYDFVH